MPPTPTSAEPVSGQTMAETACALCGQPLGHAGARLALTAEGRGFCCNGCRCVFEILFSRAGGIATDVRETEIYRKCLAAGIIPWAGKAAALATPAPTPAPDIVDQGLELSVTIEGMWCVACSWLIQEILTRLPGVLAAEVFFFSDQARLRYLPHRITPAEIVEGLNRFGYRAQPVEAGPNRSQPESWLGLGVAAILTVNIMMISLALYGGFYQKLELPGIHSLSLPLFLLATPVVFYSGWPILRRGWQGLRLGRPCMDTLIAIGSLAAYGYSVARMQAGSLHLYFDTAAMLITLVLIGREVEGRLRRRLNLRIGDLDQLAGGKARLLSAGREQWVATAAVRSGDRIAVKTGERVPVDGKVALGKAFVDEAMLTGESRPVAKAVDDDLLAGTLLLDGELRLVATRVGPASSLGQMIELIRQALAAKNPVEQFTDRITHWFVPLILCLAGATFLALGLAGHPLEEALLRALAVLVIACPCALGVATPLAKVAVLAAGRSRGIVIHDAPAFEQAHRLDTLIFDKTGTVTQGSFTLLELYAPAHTEAEVLRRAAAVEAGAEHFLAREIRRLAQESGGAAVACNLQTHAGLGVSGWVEGEQTAVGSRRLMEELGLSLPRAIDQRASGAEERGLSVVFAAWQGEVRALLAFGDSLRAGARQLVATLAAKGVEVWLLSGDSPRTTAAVAEQLGITHFAGHARPEDKVAMVQRLLAAGRLVGMAGDGINDAAALAVADTGFALGSNPARLMEEAADITLFGSSPERLLVVLALSERLARAIRQNLTLAFLYNGIGIPLAMLGLLNPLLAVVAMFASSLTVIANTLRVVGMADRELSWSNPGTSKLHAAESPNEGPL